MKYFVQDTDNASAYYLIDEKNLDAEINLAQDEGAKELLVYEATGQVWKLTMNGVAWEEIK